MATHEKTRQKTKCMHCEKSFFDILNLDRHCKDFHSNLSRDWLQNKSKLIWKPVTQLVRADKPSCDICNKSFARKDNLKLHILAYHTLKRPTLHCTSCGKSFCSKGVLSNHVQKYHEKSHRP